MQAEISGQPLYSFARNVTSQFGEDGILFEIMRRIGTKNRTCVEFGAWDGKHLSNTWDLWHNQGWAAILIEGDAKRFVALRDSVAAFPRVTALNAYVTPSGANSLDDILSRCGAPYEPDVLSIDIDGDEYYIWKQLKNVRPRVVVIEYNPTIPPEIDLVQLPGEYFGASARAFMRLAADKGYGLASCTETNCIFVAYPEFRSLGISEPTLDEVFPRKNLTYVVNAYDGRTYITRNPTYSAAIPALGATVLKTELRNNLFPNRQEEQKLPIASGALTPVKIFSLPQLPGTRTLAQRAYERLRGYVSRSWPGPRWQKWMERRRMIAAWYAAGRPSPPPHEIKKRTLIRYARRHRLRVLVETGTYLGEMVDAMQRRFAQIISIELDLELHRRASERFSHLPNIRIVHGDSGEALPAILAEVHMPALFWLDGHYSAGITAKGERETPILKELEHIFSHTINAHVILIDDARLFDGTHDYPTLAQLEEFVRERRPYSKFKVKDDIIRIT